MLIKDFHQSDPKNMYYSELAGSVKHYKENEKGREQMCEAVEEYAKEYAKEYAAKETIVNIKNLMKNMNLTLEEALNALGIQGSERGYIVQSYQKDGE